MNRLAARLGSRAFGPGISTPLLSALLLVARAHTAGAAGVKFTALTAKMTVPRSGHTATLLPNGEVILIGGENLCCDIGTTYNSAELYDPVANTFTALTATMTTARGVHRAALLPDGQVLLTGGVKSTAGPALNTAEVYTSSVLSSAIAATDTCMCYPLSDTSPQRPHSGGSFHVRFDFQKACEHPEHSAAFRTERAEPPCPDPGRPPPPVQSLQRIKCLAVS